MSAAVLTVWRGGCCIVSNSDSHQGDVFWNFWIDFIWLCLTPTSTKLTTRPSLIPQSKCRKAVGTIQLMYSMLFFSPSGERCWHSTNRNIQTDTTAVFLCKLYSGVCMFSPSFLTGVSCNRWLPEWGGWWGRRGKVRPMLDLDKEMSLLGSTRNCKPKYTIGVKC